MSKMINKNKILFITSLSLASIFLVGSVFANYLVQDNASPIGFQIQLQPQEEKYYLVGSFSNNTIDEQYLLTKQSDGSYTYGNETTALLCQTNEQVQVFSNDVSVSTYTIPIEGTYSFTFQKEASTLSTTRYSKAVYLYLINKVRIWDNGYSVYAWNSSTSMNWNTEGKMTYDSTTGCYKYLIKEEYTNVIFHNSHTNTNDARIQTGDLTYNLSTPLYQMRSNKGGTWTAINSAKLTTLSTDSFERYLVGSFNSWTTQDRTYGFEKSGDNSQNIYSLHLNVGDQFKIVGQSGWNDELNYYNIDASQRGSFNYSGSNIVVKTAGNYTFYVKETTIYFSMF